MGGVLVFRESPKVPADRITEQVQLVRVLARKLTSLSHCQELGQLTELASDWLISTLEQLIRSQLAC